MKKIRIMILNAGYLRGISGLKREYVLKINRLIFSKSKSKKNISNNIADIIRDKNPDILFLAEVKDDKNINPIKSLFARNQIDVKYKSNSILNVLPYFKGNSNGVFLHNSFEIKKRYFTKGSKKLFYQIDVDKNFSIFFSHFSLRFKTRKKQFSEIAQIAKLKEKSIIAGDFNIFKGTDELKYLLNDTNLSISSNVKDKTFPSCNPSHLIDLFLASSLVNLKKIEILDKNILSDHLPVVADYEFLA